MKDRQLNILIVEDDASHQALLKYYLNKGVPGVGLRIAASLAGAREAILLQRPDLALIDLNLPDGRGAELLGGPENQELFPTIIMTSQGDEQAAVDAIKGGASDYVVKSEATFEDIHYLVERVLRDWSNRAARKKAEEELRRSESKYRRLTLEFQTILEGISDSIALIDDQHRLIWANRVAINASAPGQEWQSGTHCYTLWQGLESPCVTCPVSDTFQTGLPTEETLNYNDGRVWSKRSFPLKNRDGTVANVILMATDITEKMQLRAETMRSSQLAALGELAAGVGHEINNPLNGVINYAQLLLDRGLPEEERELAQNIIDEGVRMAVIVSNLLTFSRKPQDEPQPVSLTDAVNGVLKLTAVKLRHDNILLETDLEDDLPLVLGHFQQLQQVIINVISNASYALNRKFPGYDPRKKMVIDLRRFESDGQSWLRTTITDLGIGIAPEMLDKVCDPFFTTKPQGSGTGLGMSISHGIIKAHGGRLLLRSVPDSWTKVVIDLPLDSSKRIL